MIMMLFEMPIGPTAVAAAGLAAVWGGFELRDRAQRMTTWSSVRGRVTGGALVTDNTPMEEGGLAYYPVVRYEYVVAGQEYRGDRRTLVKVGGSGIMRIAAQRVLDRYPVGSEVEVFYDPQHPGDAILERPSPVVGPSILIALGAALLVGGLAWSWWGKA